MSSASPSGSDSGNVDFQRSPRGDGFVGWVKEKPWHLWVTVITSVVLIYLTWRIWQGQNTSTGATVPSTTGSTLGSVLGTGDGAVTLTTTPVNSSSTGSTTDATDGGVTSTQSSSSVPSAAQPAWWQGFVGTSWVPGSPTSDADYYEVTPGAYGGNTFASIAKFFGVAPQTLTNDPHEAGIYAPYRQNVNMALPAGTEVWIPPAALPAQKPA